jgi:hypothetical protein
MPLSHVAALFITKGFQSPNPPTHRSPDALIHQSADPQIRDLHNYRITESSN